jgi:ribosomal-protein-alanine N-acetyltransferase
MSALVRIDPMADADVAAVVALDASAQVSEEELRAELARSWSRVWVAREDGEGVVAFVVFWHVADELHLLNLATRGDRRRRGVARALMEEVVGYAGRHRVRFVLLEVRRSNRSAISLYRALGFFAVGVRPRYYSDDEDAVEMALSLDRATGAVVPGADEVHIDD